MSLILGTIAAVTFGLGARRDRSESYLLGSDVLGAEVDEVRREPPLVRVRGNFLNSVVAGLTVAGILTLCGYLKRRVL